MHDLLLSYTEIGQQLSVDKSCRPGTHSNGRTDMYLHESGATYRPGRTCLVQHRLCAVPFCHSPCCTCEPPAGRLRKFLSHPRTVPCARPVAQQMATRCALSGVRHSSD